MTKRKKKGGCLLLITILIIVGIACVPLVKHTYNFTHEQGKVTRVKKKVHKAKKKHIATWGYPFKRLYEKKIAFKSGQEYGETDVMRRTKPKSYFHDGFDFGFSEVGHSPVLAIHDGIVHKVHYRPGMGLYVWIISKDGYVEIYQEGFLNDYDIYVKKGQHVKLGQKIGKLTGSHIHLGVTKTDKHYIDKHGDPCGNWWKNNGTWLNPMKIINNDLKEAGQYHQ
ncbi:M23 family metallopeptidase [Lactobacillus hamsteri]|uniref:Enterolysin A n=1 Tax=Lactobacillus hamsteri DSM 5661 = JCM 6256 TaxID=1423754 RepID=A0A0R1Y6J0_9LACO|nr:M23 family metallopeptidase [Lactobacillus hamsteri]KRM38039.1 enterolysin A [Lactobacillus hamsteri DSM 5661 = JCM 6256]